jgi:hypothetical protein
MLCPKTLIDTNAMKDNFSFNLSEKKNETHVVGFMLAYTRVAM